MEVSISRTDEYSARIRLIGQFWDRDEFLLFKKHIQECHDSGVRQIVLDLSRLTFISSQGLGLFATLFSDVKKNNGELIIYKPKGCVKELLEISGFDMFMKIAYSDKELERQS